MEPTVSTADVREDPVLEPRSRVTIGVGLLVLAMAVPYLYVAVELALITFGDRQLDAYSAEALSTLELDAVEAGNLLAIAFWVLAIVSGYVLLLGINLLRLREWARHAALLTFSFFGLLMLPMAIAGMTHDPPSQNAWFGVLLGLADLAVVVLLLTRDVSDDFGDAEWLRRYRARNAEARPLFGTRGVRSASRW